LAELREQLKSGLVSETTARVATAIEELSGRGKFDLVLKRGANEAMQFDGKMALDNARLRFDVYTLSEIKGELAFTPSEIKGEKIRAQLGWLADPDPAGVKRLRR
jgi:hydroxypyruvate isomerase